MSKPETEAERFAWQEKFIKKAVCRIAAKYPYLSVGCCYHSEVDVWEIFHTNEKLRNDHEINSFAGGILKEAFDINFFNLFIDYSYKKDMETRAGRERN